VLTRGSSTDASNIALIWEELSAGLSRGYADISGYNIYWNDTGSLLLRATVATTYYSETNVVKDKLYLFKISALNVYGEGPLSESLLLIAARVPDSP